MELHTLDIEFAVAHAHDFAVLRPGGDFEAGRQGVAADAVLAWATTPWMALGGVALWGLHMGLTQGVLAAMVAGTAPAALRGSAFGVFNLISGVMLLVASVLAGALWQHVGPAATFVAGGVMCCITLFGLPWVRPLRPGGRQ